MSGIRIYISGPMTGLAEMNFPAFIDAAARLRAAGYDVESPHEVETITNGSWEHYMRADIALLLTCEAVATLDGYENSRGARARELGLAIEPLDKWLEQGEVSKT